MHEIFISVIIPVYNVEKYIDKCINSLLNQTFNKFEMIFVGDKCSDNSMSIVEEYKKNDNRIITIYNDDNLGPGLTRNKGINIARGEYLSFVDPDDWLDHNFYEHLYTKAIESNADIIKGDFKYIDSNNNDLTNSMKYSSNDSILKKINNGRPLYSCFISNHYTAIYKTAFIKTNNLFYPDFRVGEDSIFLLKVCTSTNNIAFCNDAIYYYFKRENSIIENNDYNRQVWALKALETRLNILKLNKLDNVDYISGMFRYYLKKLIKYIEDNKVNIEDKFITDYFNKYEELMFSLDNYSTVLPDVQEFFKLKMMLKEKENSPKISVIIPVYNCVSFLNDLFDSLLNQTFDDYEVIFVDDGSNDNSLDLIIELCNKDDRFCYVSQKNKGAGVARNLGLTYARGKYVIWLDADDSYSLELLSELYTAIENHDAEISMCLYKTENYMQHSVKPDLGFNKKDFPDNCLVNPQNISSLFMKCGHRITNKMYNKEYITNNNFQFSVTFSSNDIVFDYATMAIAEKVVGVHKELLTVHRFINPSSITSNRDNHTDDAILEINKLYEWLKTKNIHDKYLRTYIAKAMSTINYNCEYSFNSKYINTVVDTLCLKQPWVSLDLDKLQSYWAITNTNQHKIDLYNTLKCNASDDAVSNYSIRRLNNLIFNIDAIEKLAEEKYNVILNPNRRLSDVNYLNNRIMELESEIIHKDKIITREVNSLNYRVGKFITFVPKKIYYFFKNLLKK